MNPSPAIVGLATRVPDARYTQTEIFDYLFQPQDANPRRTRAARVVFGRAGVQYRHMVADSDFFLENRSTQARNDRYMHAAVPLGSAAITAVLAQSGYTAADIDDLIIVSCTGISIPGLDLQLAGQLGMRSDLRRSCILGMGCYGAFPGLLRATDSASNAQRLALVLTLELCSLHLQRDDSAETIVSSALFGDGAAAVLVSNHAAKSDFAAPQIIGSATACDYQTLDHMAFHLTDHGFRMFLSSYVPDLLSAQVEPFVDQLLAQHHLTRQQVRLWGIHPGSTKIVDYVQQRLHLADHQVAASHEILHQYGNMSSATVLFVLQRMIECQHPQPGEYGVLLAFGPGLTMEGILLRW